VAVEVDGVLRCDEELSGLPSYVRSGDRMIAGRVEGRMDPAMIEALELSVDVNEASRAELETLPRVGPVLAGRIVDARPFGTVEDLIHVSGIGPKTLARIRARASVGDRGGRARSKG
jgi:DNA uptake protein ComE-like DNA-binding protein